VGRTPLDLNPCSRSKVLPVAGPHLPEAKRSSKLEKADIRAVRSCSCALAKGILRPATATGRVEGGRCCGTLVNPKHQDICCAVAPVRPRASRARAAVTGVGGRRVQGIAMNTARETATSPAQRFPLSEPNGHPGHSRVGARPKPRRLARTHLGVAVRSSNCTMESAFVQTPNLPASLNASSCASMTLFPSKKTWM
jgi:hypothetical protein